MKLKILQSFKDFLKTGTAKDIQERCKPFLEKSEGLPLYRGYKYGRSSVREVPVRKDRRPLNTKAFVHDLLDKYFMKKFGVKLRSEGLFTTGKISQAKNYGNPYYVFPVGEFKFVWGELENGMPLADSYMLSQELDHKLQTKKRDDAETYTAELADTIQWHTDNLADAMRAGAEITILCDSVILVPADRKYQEVIGG